jgi:P-type Ca2+ transporter type 2B
VHYKETPKWERLDAKTRDLLIQCISINSNYSTQIVPPKQAGEQMQQLGNKTECGLLGLVHSLGQSYQTIRDFYPESKFAKVKSTTFYFKSIIPSFSGVYFQFGS